jgi:hypothetical protein
MVATALSRIKDGSGQRGGPAASQGRLPPPSRSLPLDDLPLGRRGRVLRRRAKFGRRWIWKPSRDFGDQLMFSSAGGGQAGDFSCY